MKKEQAWMIVRNTSKFWVTENINKRVVFLAAECKKALFKGWEVAVDTTEANWIKKKKEMSFNTQYVQNTPSLTKKVY